MSVPFPVQSLSPLIPVPLIEKLTFICLLPYPSPTLGVLLTAPQLKESSLIAKENCSDKLLSIRSSRLPPLFSTSPALTILSSVLPLELVFVYSSISIEYGAIFTHVGLLPSGTDTDIILPYPPINLSVHSILT